MANIKSWSLGDIFSTIPVGELVYDRMKCPVPKPQRIVTNKVIVVGCRHSKYTPKHTCARFRVEQKTLLSLHCSSSTAQMGWPFGFLLFLQQQQQQQPIQGYCQSQTNLLLLHCYFSGTLLPRFGLPRSALSDKCIFPPFASNAS